MPLADFQAEMRCAIIDGETAALQSILTGGREPLKRFAIHQRHYESSLVRNLVEKFPATVWLAGSPFVTAAARDFIRKCPPRTPCIAEYGEGFPAFIAARPEAQAISWLRWVGALEWLLGQASLAVEPAPLAVEALTKIDPVDLADRAFVLQPGLRYLAAPWPVDDLLKLFLSGDAPERYALDAEDVLLEVRGDRGTFSIDRLDPGTFVFRRTLANGASVGDAAGLALDRDPAFDAGQGLVRLIANGMATAVTGAGKGRPR